VTLPPSEGAFASTPAVANGVVYTMNQTEGGAGGVLALAASNGTILFGSSSGFGDSAGARPIVVNGAVYAPCGDSNGGICRFGLSKKKRK
jgi:outer membrane protein assembly factor BamB